MSETFYRSLHYISIFSIFFFSAINLLSANKTKLTKVLSMVSGILVLVGGMGLLARLGFSHAEPWPLWVKLKVGIWLVVAVSGPVLAKKMQGKGIKAYSIIFGLLSLAALIAVIKPHG